METIEINDLMHDRGRGPELRGHRITVYDLVPYWERGNYTDGELMTDVFRTISANQLAALKQYFEANREAVMAWHEKIEERNRRGIAAQDTPENRNRSAEFRRFLDGYLKWARSRVVKNGTPSRESIDLIAEYRDWLRREDRLAEVVV